MLSRRAAPCLAGIAALLGGTATPAWPQGEGIPGGDPGSGFYSAADLARTAAAAEPGDDASPAVEPASAPGASPAMPSLPEAPPVEDAEPAPAAAPTSTP